MSWTWKIIIGLVLAIIIAGIVGGLVAAYGQGSATTSVGQALIGPVTTTTEAATTTTDSAAVSATSVPNTTTSTAPALTTATSSSSSGPTSLDRRNPESVLRAYFSAWQNSDWTKEASFMSAMFANMVPEPVKSLSIVDLHLIEHTSTHYLYEVTFNFVPKGDPVSMEKGQYDWTYDLNWDSGRHSWIITNYGEG